jgi:hypothetical protein
MADGTVAALVKDHGLDESAIREINMNRFMAHIGETRVGVVLCE